MFGISFEHILIVGVIFLLVGPRRLPELGNSMGKAIKNFKDALNGKTEPQQKIADQSETKKPEDPQS